MSRVDTIARLSALPPSPRKIQTSFSEADLTHEPTSLVEDLLIDTNDEISRWEKRPAGPSRAIRLDQLRAELALLDAEMIRRQG